MKSKYMMRILNTSIYEAHLLFTLISIKQKPDNFNLSYHNRNTVTWHEGGFEAPPFISGPPSNSGLQGPPFQPVNNTYDTREQF